MVYVVVTSKRLFGNENDGDSKNPGRLGSSQTVLERVTAEQGTICGNQVIR